MTIKAIETQYAGCRFRSRLEARWAVFLDHLNIAWEYEPQGFVTPTGPYLPDFWLPRYRTWLEIKGAAPTEYDLDRCTHVARAMDEGMCFFILGDLPRKPSYHPVRGPLGIQCVAWAAHLDDFVGFVGEGDAYWLPVDLPALLSLPKALTAARSARFEHGESG